MLGTDPKRGDQMVRGAVSLPHGRGKKVRVAVFCSGESAERAREAGADVVGADDLVDRLAAGGSSAIDFDAAVATPDMMKKIGRIARLLGPRGLMPNPKVGTVTLDVAAAIKELKGGRVEFRADRFAVVNTGVGKVSFEPEAIAENAAALVAGVLAARPKGVKGSGLNGYVKKAYLSSTLGRGMPLSLPALAQAVQAYSAKLR